MNAPCSTCICHCCTHDDVTGQRFSSSASAPTQCGASGDEDIDGLADFTASIVQQNTAPASHQHCCQTHNSPMSLQPLWSRLRRHVSCARPRWRAEGPPHSSVALPEGDSRQAAAAAGRPSRGLRRAAAPQRTQRTQHADCAEQGQRAEAHWNSVGGSLAPSAIHADIHAACPYAPYAVPSPVGIALVGVHVDLPRPRGHVQTPDAMALARACTSRVAQLQRASLEALT